MSRRLILFFLALCTLIVLLPGFSFLYIRYAFGEYEFDWSKDKWLNHVSPQYVLGQATYGNSDLKKMIDSSDTWPPATYVQAYMEETSVSGRESFKVRYANGLRGVGTFVKKVKIKNALDGKVVFQKEFDSSVLKLQYEPCESFMTGCAFSSAFEISFEEFNKSGVFYIYLEDEHTKESWPVFAVRNKEGPSDVSVVFPDYTWQAYNYSGGGSFYGYHHPIVNEEIFYKKLYRVIYKKSLKAYLNFFGKGGYYFYQTREPKNRRYILSLDRPYFFSELTLTNFDHSPRASIEFVKRAQEMGLSWKVLLNSDFDKNKELLKNEKLLILTGHDEYWTEEIYSQVESYIRKGGHIANFGGNLAHKKTFRKGNKLFLWETQETIKGDKYQNLPFDKTGPTVLDRINRTVENFACLAFRYGGYPIYSQFSKEVAAAKFNVNAEAHKNSRGAVVTSADHPVFSGLGWSNGYRFGVESEVVGNELDGVVSSGGEVSALVKNLFPSQLKILATTISYTGDNSPWQGVNEIGIFVDCVPFDGGGRVLNFGSITVGQAMYKGDKDVSQLVKNSISYLLSL